MAEVMVVMVGKKRDHESVAVLRINREGLSSKFGPFWIPRT